MEPDLLNELALRHGTDKSSTGHDYAHAYESLFGSQRMAVRRVLEIGVASGSSLRMWTDYFPNAEIVAIDYDAAALANAPEHAIRILGDQSDPKRIAEQTCPYAPFDLIVDDGSHYWSHQIECFAALWTQVRPGGFYAIEDLHTSYWPSFASGEATTVDVLRSMLDKLNLLGRSGYAADYHVCTNPDLWPLLDEWERSIYSIHFFRSLAILQKRLPSKYSLA